MRQSFLNEVFFSFHCLNIFCNSIFKSRGILIGPADLVSLATRASTGNVNARVNRTFFRNVSSNKIRIYPLLTNGL
jgi:hypothetical protein